MDNNRSARPLLPEQRPSSAPPVTNPAPPPPAPPGARQRQPAGPPVQSVPRMAGRPRYFPSAFTWLRVGMGRSWRGVLGALLSTWYYVPFALVMSVFSAVVLGISGFFGGLLFGQWQVPAAVTGLPLLGPAVDAFLPTSGGIIGGLVGVGLGLVLGFLGALLVFWVVVFANDPVTGLGWLLGVAAAGLFVGVLYMLYRVIFERSILRLAGARRMSRRERELLLPIVQGCAQRLGLANHPPLLIDDSREPSAMAYTRHLVISQGMLEEFQYDREVLAGLISHELVHWRNADPVSAAFMRGVALPLYLIHAATGWLAKRLGNSLGMLVLWVVCWPVLVTVELLVMPMQAADARRAEEQADQGAVLAGHRDGLRRVLGRLRYSFEAGRNGWSQSMCATHPPNELRLERLEDPSRHYPLPEPDSAGAAPLPVPLGGSLRQD